MRLFDLIFSACCLQAVACASTACELADAATRPNILLVYAEDISTELGCYGHPAVRTPHLDGLSSSGVRYENAFCTAPSCTPSRNAMMTGVFQTHTDTQDQRRGGVRLPDGVRPFPELLREAGYYTALGCGYSNKTDLNFFEPPGFDADDWSGRATGQPFFAQITLGVTHRHPGVGWSKIRAAATNPVDPAEVVLPPYFPDDPECRLDWAGYLDSIEAMDTQVGEILERLREEGIADRTVVLFMGDNGRCHLRGKCWLYDPGIRVPLIARYLDSRGEGTVESGLVSALDVTATILRLAEVEPPAIFQGVPLIGPQAAPRTEVFAARDLVDEVRDPIRCVRTERFKYLRNYAPENGYRECRYVQDNRPMLAVMRRLDAEGLLSEAQRLVLAEKKTREELYDLVADPHEINNLADSPEHGETLEDLSGRLDRWLTETDDQGLKIWSMQQRSESGEGASPAPARAGSYLNPLREELPKQWPNNRRVTVVFHGHSVPTGYFRGGSVRPFDSYPHLTHVAVKQKYPTSVVSAIVTGIGGENAEQGAVRFAEDVLAKRPDVVTIDYSLNDRVIGLERAWVAWDSMIRQALQAGVKVILLTPSADANANIDNPDDPLRQHAEQVRQLAAEHGVGLVDSLTAFRAEVDGGTKLADLLSQANHPNRRGHELIAKLLAEWF